MKINKSLDIDLNIISPQRNIQIHEGDIDSIDIVLAVSADDESLDLTGLTIKYDATINNYLAEQDANGSVVENKIVIPVTENMTAMPGLLLIDVRMIQGDEVLFTQTISAIVDKAVVNGSTYIDFSKITINQRLNALEEQMAYVEELVDGLDTSKQITSNRRPPQTAPSTVDVDFFRVGDTWIYQGSNIVYKLVEAEYNYQPDPEVPAVHKFTWQPLNERFNFGTTEPPTSATYTPIEYIIGELTFNALPVPEYFTGDTYAQIVSGAVKTLFTLTDSAEVSAGQYTFGWHENGGGDADNKMDLAPINPTAQEIEAMPSGQFYGDTVNRKGIIKDGQEFYDTNYINNNYYNKTSVDNKLIKVTYNQNGGGPSTSNTNFKRADIWIDEAGDIWMVSWVSSNIISWKMITRKVTGGMSDPPTTYIITAGTYPPYEQGDLYFKYGSSWNEIDTIFVLLNYSTSGTTCYLKWIDLKSLVDLKNYYTKTEIDSMIGDIGTALDTLNDNLAEV